MTPEITALALAGILQVVQIFLYVPHAIKQVGHDAAYSPRDEGSELTGRAGRIQRAMNNHFEGLILFTIAVVVVTLGDASNLVTQICAWIYVAARVLYIPAYVFGWVPWRSHIWTVGLLATTIMMITALL
ncbi:MAPEG family protein [Amylibacter sp. SFDW26]|uniref:MAPEG family protein n=1 Tax=Amylibacter sp. SFDW26 TaxID=2652722 RepID=UPI001262841D|nr:MAPEG family protein [Amylibacter sp. SFDW26]KAB7615223.1 MAPEG family protein [Amylibacter sp. SFDW26]